MTTQMDSKRGSRERNQELTGRGSVSLCWLEEVGDAGIAVAELPGVEEEADGGDGLGPFRINSLRVGV